MRHKACGAVLLLALLPAAVMAQSTTPPADSPERAEARAKVRAACAADVQKFCAGIERGKGAMRACLEEHATSLSTECSAARAERTAARAKEKS